MLGIPLDFSLVQVSANSFFAQDGLTSILAVVMALSLAMLLVSALRLVVGGRV